GTAAGGGVGAGGSPARGRRGVAHGTPDARRGGGAVRDAPAGEPGRARRPLGVHGGGGRLAAAREAGRSGVRVVARVAAGQASARLRGSPWQSLYFRPHPHGHPAFRPTLANLPSPVDSVRRSTWPPPSALGAL